MIKPVSSALLELVLPLIKQYQAFYQINNIGKEQNRQFFSQFGEHSEKGCQFAYLINQQPVAFASVYFSYSSTLASKVAIMNDLYTTPEYRNKGIARELINHCAHYALRKGACRLQWVTAKDNIPAQSLYRKIGAKQSSWEFFSYVPAAHNQR